MEVRSYRGGTGAHLGKEKERLMCEVVPFIRSYLHAPGPGKSFVLNVMNTWTKAAKPRKRLQSIIGPTGNTQPGKWRRI